MKRSFINYFTIISSGLIIILLSFLLYFLWNISDNTRKNVSLNRQILSREKESDGCSDQPGSDYFDYEILNLGGCYTIGTPDAPVTIVLFSDFECPFCHRFISDVLPEIREKYVTSGKVKIIFTNYPLRSHRTAFERSRVFLSIREYYTGDDLLERFSALKNKNIEFDEKYFKGICSEFDLDYEDLITTYNSGEILNQLWEEYDNAVTASVSSVPTLLVNETRLKGSQSFSEISRVIDDELAFAERRIVYDDLQREMGNGTVFLDVRTEKEFLNGTIPGAVNLDYLEKDTFIRGLIEYPRSQRFVVFCQSGKRAKKAFMTMNSLGFKNALYYKGSYADYSVKAVNN